MRKFLSLLLIVALATYGTLPAMAQQSGSSGSTATSRPALPPGLSGLGGLALPGSTAPGSAQTPDMQMGQSLPGQNQTNQNRPERPTITNQDASNQEQNQQVRRKAGDNGDQIENNPPKPVPVKTPFQMFVEQGTGTPIEIYGSKFFADVPSTYAPLEHVPVPSDYVIGPGDEIMVRAWGQIDITYRGYVDRNGLFYLPKVGTLHVSGIRADQLQDFLHTAVGRVFRNFEMQATLGDLRSIQIFATGYAQRPGTYTLSSLSTLLNAVFAVGGPSPSGSMRHIEVRRGTATISSFDLYDVLLRGDKSKDVQLLPGDVLYFAPVGPQVALVGTVKQPAIYELREKNCTVGEAVNFSGGLDVLASGAIATIESINNRTIRAVDQIKVDEPGLGRKIQDGDVITFYPVSGRFENAVTLRGSVAIPGRRVWHPGMKVSELVPDLYALIPESHWTRQNTISMVSQRGSLSGPGTEQGTADTTGVVTPESQVARGIQSEIRSNTAEVNWDYALIERMDPRTLESHLINFNLRRALIEPDSPENRMLEAGDIVTVFSQGDLRVPTELQAKYVYLEGEFAVPGVYKVEAGESLHHLVERVGGFTPKAYLYGSTFTRESVKNLQQARLDEAVRRMQDELQRSAAEQAGRMIDTSQSAGNAFAYSTQQRILAEMRSVKAEGRVVFGIKPDDSNLKGVPDIPLEDGDRWIVPSEPNFVSVIGAVNNNSSFVYRNGARASEYLRDAGGGTRYADMKRAFILKANGSVAGSHGSFSKSAMSTSLMPGDTVVIPEQIERNGFMRNLRDWATILSQFGLGAAAVKVLSQ